MSPSPEFRSLLPVLLNDGKNCKCPHKGSCGQGNEWCRNIAFESNGARIVEYMDLDIARCAYRERLGCCSVLAGVERLASDFLKRGGCNCPPVSSDLINVFDEIRKIQVSLLQLRGYAGATWLMEDYWVIQLNVYDSTRERRHTLFHEAFHVICRNASPAFKKKDLQIKPFVEILADHFAVSLLMPQVWIEERWPTTRDVQKMSDMFNVPLPRMRHRLGQFGLLQQTSNSY